MRKDDMKHIILSHKTALSFTRDFRILNNKSELINRAESVVFSKKRHGDDRLDVMVNSSAQRHKNWRYSFHLQSKPLPKNSIIQINEHISIVCPELLLIQLSRLMPLEQLSIIALEFCGTYSVSSTNGKFVSNLSPVTSVSKINKYLEKFVKFNKTAWGIKNIRKILKFLQSNSASPMESQLYLHLCGPRWLGFYSCKKLLFNTKINLSKEAQKIAGQAFVVPDLVSVDAKLAIEYNSAKFHENQYQSQKDHRRRDALVYDGWQVFSFTPEQFYDKKTFEIIATSIKKALHARKQITEQ